MEQYHSCQRLCHLSDKDGRPNAQNFSYKTYQNKKIKGNLYAVHPPKIRGRGMKKKRKRYKRASEGARARRVSRLCNDTPRFRQGRRRRRRRRSALGARGRTVLGWAGLGRARPAGHGVREMRAKPPIGSEFPAAPYSFLPSLPSALSGASVHPFLWMLFLSLDQG